MAARRSLRVVAYDARRHRGAFAAVNREWIEHYFRMEPHDEELLGDPATHVLGGAARGEIFVCERVDEDECGGGGGGGASALSAAAEELLAEGDDNPRVLGACALMRLPPDRAPPEQEPAYELAKMGVRESARGRGAGRLLGEAAMARAWGALGARSVHIWSNTVLAPAIALYKTLGFVECEMGEGEVFERANIRLLALPPPPPPAGAAAGASSGGAAAIGAPPR